ncbi:DUF1190 domain-containing protein [Pseudofulvimonas gallinarii]|jgi:uncharacterized protein YgiB involved in biofilm formation|uniref:Uncharacterized protein YgiB involved in biofilm formation n=1 Tax=Pseudofulvimonas gallinarii TaxID=634155 RepID=A0A4V2UW72_9GAMM|nr:DUF1190 domain-containing protein [Pseudofulvimonas gallinarii]TCS98497.1 uncharacterized protein YgiB involved in biofilm formation [Pseudofulvimonas gallinarii]THD13704.1 hypothetical protein B1808_06645 [Pseudofulvimonas gallinarii]
MKRSSHIALVLMGTSPLLLTACSRESADEGLYTSAQACIEQTNDSYSCNQAFEQAQREYAQAAPQYATREECVAAHGADQCQVVRQQQGSSIFMPMMAGYIMGRMLSGNRVSGLAGTPAFRDRAGGFQRPVAGANGVYRAGSLGRPAMAPVQMAANQKPTASRGGFGGQGSQRSSGG